MEINKNIPNGAIELNDDMLDNVAGGANLDAWWNSGYQGAPVCNKHFNVVVMDSYFKDGKLCVKCPQCRVEIEIG